jgi:hypothetical protein
MRIDRVSSRPKKVRGAAVAIASPGGGSIELDSLNEGLAPLSIVRLSQRS